MPNQRFFFVVVEALPCSGVMSIGVRLRHSSSHSDSHQPEPPELVAFFNLGAQAELLLFMVIPNALSLSLSSFSSRQLQPNGMKLRKHSTVNKTLNYIEQFVRGTSLLINGNMYFSSLNVHVIWCVFFGWVFCVSLE